MPDRTTVFRFGFLVLSGFFLAGDGWTQAVCTGLPGLGSTGPELCVNVFEDDNAISLDFRGPSPIVVNQTIGDYRVNLNIAYAASGDGMAVSMTGTVIRTSPGAGGISVRADGGTNASVPASTGSLDLSGFATGSASIQLGGAAGFPSGGGSDVNFVTFSTTCDALVNLGGGFQCSKRDIPISAGATATTNITGFHVTNVGDFIDIPSGSGVGALPPIPKERFVELAKLTPDNLILENQIAPHGSGPNPDLVVLNLHNTAPNENRLDAFKVPPPYDGSGVTFYEDIDFGPLFGIVSMCRGASGKVYAPYTKFNGGNFDTFVAEFDGSSWSTMPITATSIPDVHTAACATGPSGDHIFVYNDTSARIDVLKRGGAGVFFLSEFLDSGDLGGTPGSPFDGHTILHAASAAPGSNDLAFIQGLTSGLTVVTQFDPTTPGGWAVKVVDTGDGEASINSYFDRTTGEVRTVANWQDGGSLMHGSWANSVGPGSIDIVNLGTMGPRTLHSFQGMAGGGSRNGDFRLWADDCYILNPGHGATPDVSTPWECPCKGNGGPMDMITLDDELTTFGVCSQDPLGQVLAEFSSPSIFTDGFESGDTTAWSSTIP